MKTASATLRKSSRKSIVWVVVHCELMGPTEAPHIDEMVFHVASLLAAAERYLRRLFVAPYSWWMVERRVVDEADTDADDSPQRQYFNYRGQPRQSPPHKAARRAYDKSRQEAAGAA
jgi:hypothetical protein